MEVYTHKKMKIGIEFVTQNIKQRRKIDHYDADWVNSLVFAVDLCNKQCNGEKQFASEVRQVGKQYEDDSEVGDYEEPKSPPLVV